MKTIYTTIIILALFGLRTNAQWTLTATAPPATGPIDPLVSDGINLFGGSNCSTGFGNIFLTTNDGNTWTSTTTGLPSFQFVTCIAFHGSTIFSGLAVGGSNTGLGVYKSINNGTSWSAANTGLPNNAWVSCIAANGSNVFAGIPTHGVYLSTNDGSTWTNSSTGLSSASQFYSITFSGSNIFVGTDVGVFKSTNNGGNWTAVNNGLPSSGSAYFTRIGSVGSNILVGTWQAELYVTTNYGNSWSLVYSANTWISGIVTSGSKVFIGADNNVLMSLDSGLTWINIGSFTSQTSAIEATSTNLFVAHWADVWKIDLSQLTGIEENQNQSVFSIAPNPFTTQTAITFNEEQNNTVIKIIDLLGKEIKTKNFSGKQCILEKREMQEGVYFVQITDAKKKVINKKIIVQ